ncbi:Major sperm protein [Dirofilaria immitis]|nr:Major sperm protein [Dirofilaria immitis]
MFERSDDGSNSMNKILGDTPEFEVQLIPSWIIFTAVDNYRTSQYARFKIRNNDPVPIIYRIRTKERSFPRFSTCHGYLEPNAEDEVYILIPASDCWPRDPVEYAGHRHKVMIENLTFPKDAIKPKNKNEASAISMMIFKTTPPLTRMYTKLNILLPKIIEDKTPETREDYFIISCTSNDNSFAGCESSIVDRPFTVGISLSNTQKSFD